MQHVEVTFKLEDYSSTKIFAVESGTPGLFRELIDIINSTEELMLMTDGKRGEILVSNHKIPFVFMINKVEVLND